VGADAAEVNASYRELFQGTRLLGVYKGDSQSEDIVFADGLFLFAERGSDGPRLVSYADIQTVEYPLPASESVELRIQLTDSSSMSMRVVGRHGNFRDVFEVGRFFMRVAEDAGKGMKLVR
jgi:hypothetical protein